MNQQSNDIAICPWRDDKRWVYSITFDEALSELHRFAVPILEKHRVPGHLEVVAGHIGVVRQLGASSYNGFHHMSGPELKDMIARGWGVGNHTWSHGFVKPEMVNQEIGRAKEAIEEAIGEPITIYCAAGDNSNMNDAVLDGCRRFGYLGAMSITDALNRPDDPDLLWMNRTFLHDQGYAPFLSEFDPFRNIAHARRDRGWIIDYCHCPLEKPVHRNKDCSEAQLRERIETVVSEGGDDVWLARIEDVVDYRYTRRAAKIEANGDGRFEVKTENLHPAVKRRTLTLSAPGSVKAIEVDGKAAPFRKKNDRVLCDVDVSKPRGLRFVR